MTRQLSLAFGNRHGGRRKGAGRKPKGAQAGVKHRPRPEFVRRKPVLVTQRIAADCPSLRGAEVLAIFRRLVIELGDETFAVVHWSLQTSRVAGPAGYGLNDPRGAPDARALRGRHPLRAQRSLAGFERGFARCSAGEGRATSSFAAE
jgi:hypothetical protein